MSVKYDLNGNLIFNGTIYWLNCCVSYSSLPSMLSAVPSLLTFNLDLKYSYAQSEKLKCKILLMVYFCVNLPHVGI